MLQRLIRYDHPAALLDPRLFGGTLRPASELGIGIAVLHDYLPTTGIETSKPALVQDAAPRSLGPDGRCCSNAATDKAAAYLSGSGLIVAQPKRTALEPVRPWHGVIGMTGDCPASKSWPASSIGITTDRPQQH